MPVLRYWDANQNAYIAIPSAPGQTYASVSAVAPNPVSPSLAPPMGALWVDTSTSPSAAPYVPPQTPPGSGLGTFVDAAGEPWVSMPGINGGAWRKATQVLHARVYRNAAFTAPTTYSLLPHDTVDLDRYGLWSMGNNRYVAPIVGWYQFSAILTAATPGATPMFLGATYYRNGSADKVLGQQSYGGTGYNWPVIEGVTNMYLGIGEYVQVFCAGSVAQPLQTGFNYLFFNCDYLGAG